MSVVEELDKEHIFDGMMGRPTLQFMGESYHTV